MLKKNLLNYVDLLALTIGAEVFGKIDKPTSNYFIKAGKVEEIKALVKELSADLVIFNNTLSPSQERNLGKAICAQGFR